MNFTKQQDLANLGTEFLYDANDNMIADYDREIVSIRYNLLNLPDTIQFSNGDQIINRYAADGSKLRTDYFTRVTPLTVPIIDISNFEGNKEAFPNFQGHDVSKSKGRLVSLISLDAGELKKNSKESNPYQNAETNYHEMKAHIKDGGSNDHGRYGNDQTGLDIERPGGVDYSGYW